MNTIALAQYAESIQDKIRTVVRQQLARRAEARLWEDVETYEQLCELVARFVLGELSRTPGHGGPRDPETVEIGPALAHANRAGFLTDGSQPGELIWADDAPSCKQRAAVEGFANAEVAQRLCALFPRQDRFVCSMRTYTDCPWYRSYSYEEAVAVTKQGSTVYTTFGSTLSKRHIEFIWSGIQDQLLEHIIPLHQVTVVDMLWGPNTRLWDRLVQL